MESTATTSFQTSGLRKNNTGHNIIDIVLIVVNAVSFAAMAFINIASSSGSLGIFQQQTGDISNRHPVDITPAGWTFSTWGIIYTWQALWIIYSVVSIFRKTDYGRLYREPQVLTRVFYLFMLANYALNISWLFIWDSERFGIGFGFLLLITLTLYIPLVITHKNIYEAEPYLTKNKVYLWLYRILVNNGIAFYATWVTIATSLNFAIAWTYEWNGYRSTASIVSLSIVVLLIVVYFILDVFVLEKFLRYTYSPYIQMAIAFAGVLSKNWNGKSASAILTLVLIIVAPGVMFIVKIIVSIYKHKQTNKRRAFN